jgi:hypothetical protein
MIESALNAAMEKSYCLLLYNMGRDTSVGTATRYRLDDPGIETR